jgi:STE24 endopeptidase
MNVISVLFVASLLAYMVIEWWLSVKNQRYIAQHRAEVPSEFAGIVTLASHQKAADYSAKKLSMGRYLLVFDVMLLLVLSLGGGFQFIYNQWLAVDLLTGTARDVAFILSIFAIMALLHLPFTLYSTFVIETNFGFNHMSLGMFVKDTLKQWAVVLVIGVPLLWAMIATMNTFIDDLWWLYAWLGWLFFNFLLVWAYPILIAPIFNKFTPLEAGEVKTRIEALLAKTGFDSDGIFVMDGSSRSGHGNAYFTGFGKHKRIVFYDTLIEKLHPSEVEAVLAHEIGHFKHGHIKQRLIEGGFMSLAGLALLGWLVHRPEFYTGLGLTTQTPVMALLLFLTVVPSFFFWMSPLMAIKSRKHEFEADAFAAKYASATALISALLTMYRDNASTLTPDPWYSAYHDSHPPAKIRIDHLNALVHQ